MTVEDQISTYAVGSSKKDEKIYYTKLSTRLPKPRQKVKHTLCEIYLSHTKGKNLCVHVEVFEIHEVEFADFFDQMASQIQENIKNLEFSSAMERNFSCSSSTHQIVSQINLMLSLQEFFSYEMGLEGCGIKGLEMIGEQRDWEALVTKLQKLRAMLKPVD